MKICTSCGENKPLEDFPKEAKRKDGRYPWCKPCLSKYRKDRYVKKTRKFFIECKTCSLCKKDKPREEFRKYPGNNLHYRCISCEDEEKHHTALDLKRCSNCKNWLEKDAFYPDKRHGLRAECKKCNLARVKKPTAYEKRRNASLLKFFGITLDQYKEQLDRQGHKCPICLKHLDTSKGYPHPVDHAHKGKHAGRIRAILHDYCNRFVVWKHQDGDQLRRAADLIDNPLTEWMVPEEFIRGPKKKRRKRRAR